MPQLGEIGKGSNYLSSNPSCLGSMGIHCPRRRDTEGLSAAPAHLHQQIAATISAEIPATVHTTISPAEVGKTARDSISWQHCDTSPCFPGEGVKPLPLSPRVSPSTKLSFAGMGDASTGYFWTVAVVGRVVAATVPVGPCCKCPALSPLATCCLPLLGTRVAAEEDRVLNSARPAPEGQTSLGCRVWPP